MESNNVHSIPGVTGSRLSASSDSDGDELVIDDTHNVNNGVKQRDKLCDGMNQIFGVVDSIPECDKKISNTVDNLRKGSLWSEMLIEDQKYEKMNEDLVNEPKTRRFFVDRNVETYPIWKRIAKIGSKKKKKKKKKKNKASASSEFMGPNDSNVGKTTETMGQDGTETIESNQQQNGHKLPNKQINECPNKTLDKDPNNKTPEPKSKKKSRIPDSIVVSEANNIAGKLQEKRIDIIMRLIRSVGLEETHKLLSQAMTIEEAGGLMTLTGNRRRTPGGVFFLMVRQSLPELLVQKIFKDDLSEIKPKRRIPTKLKPAKPSPLLPPFVPVETRSDQT